MRHDTTFGFDMEPKEQAKPRNRQADAGGQVIAVVSSIFATLAYLSASVNEVRAILETMPVGPDVISWICGGLALAGLVYASATRSK